MDFVISSKLSFTSILSMAKIKLWQTIPSYLIDRMSGIIDDGWIGDLKDGRNCTKFACQYVIGEASPQEDPISYFFCFGRGDTEFHSKGESPMGQNFKFCALVAKFGINWYFKYFNDSDLEHVKKTVNKHDQDAVSILELEPIKMNNPLAVIRSCFVPG